MGSSSRTSTSVTLLHHYHAVRAIRIHPSRICSWNAALKWNNSENCFDEVNKCNWSQGHSPCWESWMTEVTLDSERENSQWFLNINIPLPSLVSFQCHALPPSRYGTCSSLWCLIHSLMGRDWKWPLKTSTYLKFIYELRPEFLSEEFEKLQIF